MNKLLGGIMLLTTLLSMTQSVELQTRDRAKVPVQDTWNLADLYPTDEAWHEAKNKLAGRIDQILQFRGKLGESAETLLACLNLSSELSKEFDQLNSYASMKSDEDTRNSKYQGMKQEMMQLGTEFRSKASYIEPEIIKIDKKKIDKFLKQEPGLGIYKMYLDDLQRKKAHKLSDKEEKILAEAGLMADAPYSIYSIFSNAELPYPEVELTDGKKVLINQAGYTRYRALPNRADREKVFDAFWETMNNFRQTLGADLYANIKKDIFYMQARKYQSCLESALDDDNIPVQVYHALIENVNKNLDTFHRYLRLRQRMLGLDTLKYSDLYAPVVKDVDLHYTIEEAKNLVLEAIKPLGKKYVDVVKKGFESRWIDVYPTPGKRSGAYMNGSAYDVHPYMLLNFNGRYEDVSTLAHELGHAMHSYFSNKTQPYPTAHYSIFVAEVASTFNEALLIHKVLDEIKDDDTRLSLLMSYLDGIKGTVFRQTQFAEFELRIHEKAEKGEPLTGDGFTKLYGDIVRKYYGQDKGVCFIDDRYTVEWAYIPHFYYNFYVYQYATSFTASTALVEKVLHKEKGAVERYLNFLSSGGSDYPINLLKKAGVDMTTPEPFNKTIEAMNATMDEIEKILDKKGL